MRTKIRLPHIVSDAKILNNLGRLIYTNNWFTKLHVWNLKAKKVERSYAFGRQESGSIMMTTSEYVLIGCISKTMICGLSESVNYEYPHAAGLPWGVFSNRYFVFIHNDKLVCCDTQSGEFLNIGKYRLAKYYTAEGLYVDEEQNKWYEGSDSLNIQKKCIEYDLKELSFEGVENVEIDSVCKVGSYYAVIFNRDFEVTDVARIKIFSRGIKLGRF